MSASNTVPNPTSTTPPSRSLTAPDEFLDETQKARVAALYVAYSVLRSTGLASTTGAPVEGLIEVAEYVVNGPPEIRTVDLVDPGPDASSNAYTLDAYMGGSR